MYLSKSPQSMSHYLFTASLLFIFSIVQSEQVQRTATSDPLTPISTFATAFKDSLSNFQVMQSGIITRILSDDTVGDRHQRIIVRLSNNQTLLIAHNIDLSPRIPNPATGKVLGFYGEYEWNKDGGVIHWTHKDPQGKHINGWLEYEGIRYSSFDSAVSVISVKSISLSKIDGPFLPASFLGSYHKNFNIAGRVLNSIPSCRASGFTINQRLYHVSKCISIKED